MGKVPNHKAKKGHNKKGTLPFKRARLDRFLNRHVDQVLCTCLLSRRSYLARVEIWVLSGPSAVAATATAEGPLRTLPPRQAGFAAALVTSALIQYRNGPVRSPHACAECALPELLHRDHSLSGQVWKDVRADPEKGVGPNGTDLCGIRTDSALPRTAKQVIDEDLPGMGQFYCKHTARDAFTHATSLGVACCIHRACLGCSALPGLFRI